jgi:hypothetical protein
VALEQHNTAFEFETMLRSHLSRGGSMVEACAGFDADTASAYLEGALGQVARSRYDAHLAGCPSCRRSVIDLLRLVQSSQFAEPAAIHAEPQTVPVISPSNNGLGWKSAIAGWLGLSEWNLATRHWGLATAGAAGALLLAVLATQLWRQPAAGRESTLIPASAATAGGQSTVPLDALTPHASPVPGETATTGAAAAQEQASNHSGVPTPKEVGPAQIEQTLAANLSAKADGGNNVSAEAVPGRFSFDSPVALPIAPPPNVNPVIVSALSGQAAVSAPLVESKPPVALPEVPQEVASARIIAPLNPSPNDNPMAPKRKSPPTPSVFDRAFAFMPSRKDTGERKLEAKEIEEGAPKLLSIRVHDKVFNFHAGMWVDQAYRPDMAWRVTKLVQDSDDYKRVLAEDPQLKDFFERGSVIVVWKDKIYKIVAK